MGQLKKDLMKQIQRNRQELEKQTEYTTILAEYQRNTRGESSNHRFDDGPLEQIVDIRFGSRKWRLKSQKLAKIFF
jgi:hypothetical protein